MTQNKNTIYLASPLFSDAERNFNILIASHLEPEFHLFMPQRDGEIFTSIAVKYGSPENAAQAIFRNDISEINKCTMVLAIMDGRSIDEGVCFEIGYAFAKGKKCFALQTDSRRLLPIGNNPMLSQSIYETAFTIEGILPMIRRHLAITNYNVK